MVSCTRMQHLLRAVIDTLIPAAQAHEKWFVPVQPVASPVPDFYRTLNPYTIGAILAVLAISVVGYFVDRWYEKTALYAKFEKKIKPWRDYAPGVLAFTTGLTLVFLASRGQLLASNYPLSSNLFGGALRAAEGLIGALLMVGLFTPAAAVGLIALYLATFLLEPVIEPIDYVNFVGIGIYILYFARGRYSLDWFLGKPIMTTPEQRKWAYVALRVLTGITIFWLGLLKWRRPDLHLSLMDRFPNLNPYVLMPWIGIRVSRELYVFGLFAFEAAIGIFEIFGFLTRFVSLVLVPVFCFSVLFLGPQELIGHLPILGTLFVLFVYGDTYQKNRDIDRYAETKKPA
jgi:uncharacterized membrane protein YphA (DoxX/SURF4 family)